MFENVSFSPRPHDFVDLYEEEVIDTVKVSKFESTFAYWAVRARDFAGTSTLAGS